MKTSLSILTLLALGVSNSSAILAWTIGDSTVAGRQAPEIWNIYGAAGTTTFVQEGNGPTNPLPGDQFSPAVNQQADDDFYFAGNYANQVDGGAAYVPHGIVASTEAGIERAITNGDHTNRIHFNFSGGAAGAPDDNYAELGSSNPGTSARWANFDYFRLDYEPIPEPSSLGLLAVAAAGLMFMRRRK